MAVGCSSPERDWQEACQIDTVDGYQRFARKYPDSSLAIDAGKKIDEKKWGEAVRSEALVAYRKYSDEFPRGLHAAEATKMIESVLIAGTIQPPSDTLVTGCKAYLFAVGVDGKVTATLRNEAMGLTDSRGAFSIAVNRAELRNVASVAFIVDCSSAADLLISRPVQFGSSAQTALLLNVGHLKIASDTGDKLTLTAKNGGYLNSLNVKTGELTRLLDGATVSGKVAVAAP
jgi:hypothetical protein